MKIKIFRRDKEKSEGNEAENQDDFSPMVADDKDYQ